MEIRRLMATTFQTISKEASLAEARQRLEKTGAKRLLVVDAKGRLIGVCDRHDVSHRSLLDMATDGKTTSREHDEMQALLARLTVDDAMTHDPVSVTVDASVEVVARVMSQARRNAVPVLDDGRPVGMVDERIIYAILARILSAFRREAPDLLERALAPEE
jgi:CBS domain-containing protein